MLVVVVMVVVVDLVIGLLEELVFKELVLL
jgi:hypothetical protein